MQTAIRTLFYFGPLIFAFGFITPLAMQIITRAGWTLPFGISALTTGLIIGAALGIPAQVRGRWI